MIRMGSGVSKRICPISAKTLHVGMAFIKQYVYIACFPRIYEYFKHHRVSPREGDLTEVRCRYLLL